MKRKIGEINRKPIVIGDKNLVNEYEVHTEELQGDSGGDTSGVSLKFYRVKDEYKRDKELANWLYAYCAYWTITSDNYMNINRYGPDKQFNIFTQNPNNDSMLKAFAICTDVLDENSKVKEFNENILNKVEETTYDDFMQSINEY